MHDIFAIALLCLAGLNIGMQRWLRSALQASIGAGWALLNHSGFFEWLSSLGDDSIAEIYGFSTTEAGFWLQSLIGTFEWWKGWAGLAISMLLAAVFVVCIKRFTPKSQAASTLLASVATVALLVSVASPLLSIYKNSGKFEAIHANFNSTALPKVTPIQKPRLRLVVYIGESTTAMHMGVYGYPRRTTPKLAALKANDAGLLLFHNVFSTHSHTALSLLEALSLQIGDETKSLSILQRKRASLIDLLNTRGLSSTLVSNQGMDGAWNMASSIIFGNVQRSVFGIDTAGIGNREKHLTRPTDDALFSMHLSQWLQQKDSAVLFLHSYAGHGPYAKKIPNSQNYSLTDGWLDADPQSVVGQRSNSEKLITQVEDYDTAIRYIDSALSQQIQLVKTSDEPIVLAYFSDHGESVFTGFAHDSSRFQLEMAYVPFLLYFNQAAQSQHPELYAKYQGLADNRRVSTLARLSSTLLDLMEVPESPTFKNLGIQRTPVMGAEAVLQPIVVRSVAETVLSRSLSEVGNQEPQSATAIFAARQQLPAICYHRANSLAKVLRGKLAADCLELDIVISAKGVAEVFHPPASNTGLSLSKVFEALKGSSKTLWLDAKNIHQADQCEALAAALETPIAMRHQLFVEFPPAASKQLSSLNNCVNRLRRNEILTSYYVPTQTAKRCSSEIANSKAARKHCSKLAARLKGVLQSKLFTDLSFSLRSKTAMDALLPADHGLRLNAWGVPLSEVSSSSLKNYRLLITPNNDPNTI